LSLAKAKIIRNSWKTNSWKKMRWRPL
jgi:hypothetical protein